MSSNQQDKDPGPAEERLTLVVFKAGDRITAHLDYDCSGRLFGAGMQALLDQLSEEFPTAAPEISKIVESLRANLGVFSSRIRRDR
jgi:hypothetical protein